MHLQKHDGALFSDNVMWYLGCEHQQPACLQVMLGLRGYLTLINSDTDLFCLSGPEQASCLVKSSGSTFFQTEGQLGFSLVF